MAALQGRLLASANAIATRRDDERNSIMIDISKDLRLRYHYRRLILDGKISLSFESAKKIIGPDCAYQLYSVQDLKNKIAKPKGLR